MAALKVSSAGGDDLRALKLVASAASLEVSFTDQGEGAEPTATASAGEVVKGLAPVARCVAESGGEKVSGSFLGSTIEEQALVRSAHAPQCSTGSLGWPSPTAHIVQGQRNCPTLSSAYVCDLPTWCRNRFVSPRCRSLSG